MAKQKKEKQIPAKQQMYEQILTKQLYGAPPTREEGIAKLQADYDAWNERQQGIAKLQSEYDNWLNEQKKAQQPVKAPKVETVKAPVQQTPTIKKNKVETIAPKSEEKKYLTHADVIPSLNKKSVEKQTQMNKVAQNNAASVAKIANQLGISEDEVRQRMTAPKQELNAYNEKKIDKNTTESMQKAASEKKRKAAQKKYNPWEAFTGRFAKATTDVVNAPLAIAGKLTGKDLSIYNDAQKQEFKDIQEQHPVASTAGDLAGMAFAAYALGGGSKGTAVPKGNVTSGQVFKALRDDAILNGATKGGATAQALKGALPTLAGNAASNMPTDFAVDIIPTLANDIAEGEKSNKQIVRDTLLNTGINAGFNAIGDIASLGKAMKNSGNPITADDAFRANALEGYEKLKKYDSVDSFRIKKNPLIADYADESAQSLRLTPNNKSGLKTTEAAASLRSNPNSAESISSTPVRDGITPYTDNVSGSIENVNKNSVNFELPEETFDKIDSHFEELARPLNEVQNSGIMNNVTDEKALTEWANVNEAYSDYLDKAMFGESVEEVEAAKKALDNARKRYARAMKDIDPEVSKAFNSGSFGYKIGRPLNERNVNAISKQGQEAVDAINELENIGGGEVDLKGKRPYAKNQSVSPSIENEAKRIDKWIEDQGLEEELAEEAQEALNKASKTAGADPLQFFASGDTKGEWKTGKWRLNTAEKTGKIKNPADLPERNFAYREFKEAEQNEAALERYKDSKDIAKDLMNLDKFDEVDVKAAMNEWKRLMDAGDEMSLRKAKWLGIKIDGEVREGGRVIQALAEYSRNTPEGQLRTAQESIDKIVDKKIGRGTSEALDNLVSKINKAYIDSNGNTDAFSKRVEELLSENLRKYASSKTAKNMSSKTIAGKNTILKMISEGASIEEIADKVYKQNGGVKLTVDEQKQIFDYLKEASELAEGSYKQEELLARAAKIAVGRAPSTLGQKIRSVLYNNMLGNFKTALSRNAFGNMAYQTLEQARQPISAIVDRGTSLFTKKRSALGWNTGKAGAYIQGLKKGTVEQLTDMSKHIDTGRSGAKGWEVALANNATTYNDSNVIGKFANGVEYYVRNAMELGDRPFFEANYKQNYIELEQLVERYGKDNVAGLEGIDEKDLPEVMDMISSVRAADSVFQKHGKMSKGLTDLRNGLGEMSEGIVGVDILSTAASPFTMTPGNMIERAIEYTPLGFAKNAVETIKEVAGKKGFNQRRFVDEASRSIAGLPILYGTYKMAKNGQINGGYSTDSDERAAQQEDGFIEYGYNVPENVLYYGGKTLDTSDLPVIGPMMQAGAVMSEEGVSPASSLQAAEAILGGSTTQGIKRAFGADLGSYSSQDSVIDNLKNTVLSSGSQLVPSLVRQTAQTVDEYKRDLGEYRTNEYYLNLIKNSLPKLRETLPIKTNVEGKPVLQNQGRPLPAKILENYVLPMNVSEYTPSELNKEASRLLEKTGEASGFAPKALRKDLRAWDESDEKEYSEEQFRNYKKNLGELNSTAGTTLTNSDFYKNLSDESKVKYLSETYAAMKQVARKNATGSIGDNKAAQAYIDAGGGEKGIKKMIEYFQARDIAKTNNVSTNSKAYEAIETAVNNGAIGRAKEIASAEKEKKDVFKKYGLENNSTSQKLYDNYDESALKDYADFQKEGLKASAVYVYQSAKKEGGTIPSIKDFAKTYKKMDSYGDNNGSVSQKEFSAYLDSGNYSLEEATSLAQTYGDWKSIPYLKKDGHWGFHKAK